MSSLRLLLHRYTFRLALMYLALFCLSFLLLFGFLYWNADQDQFQQLRDELEADARHFVERDQLSSRDGVIRLLSNRIHAQRQTGSSLYVYRNAEQEVLAGTLGTWPLSPDPLPDATAQQILIKGDEYLAWRQPLPTGGEVLLGKSTAPIQAARSRLIKVFAVSTLLTLALGSIGGMLLSRRASARIEAINRLCESIIDGDLSQRLATRDDQSDDLDQLSHNINRMLDRIQTLMQEVSTVSNHIAHDLRTPLSRLRNQLESLLLAFPGEASNDVSGAIEEADRLLDTFNALLRIAKIEAGERQSDFASLDLSALAQDVVEMYAPLAEEHGVTLSLHAPASLYCTGDKNLLFQAFANLLDNALKHGLPEQTVSASARIQITVNVQPAALHRPAKLQFSVCDTGPGIPHDELEKATQRFYRGQRSQNTPGNGLGLSLVKAIATLHNGELDLQTNAGQSVTSAVQSAAASGLCAVFSFPKK